jgi:hypothetical protein
LQGDDEFLSEFVKYLNQLTAKAEKGLFVEFDFSRRKIISGIGDHQYKFLNLARKLKIITYRSILLKRDGQEFSFKDSSSGQSHILTSMLSLASVIEENSLILIDEPETSLHPNWQMSYFDLINKVFKKFKGSHFIVASHSHFLGSDLRPKSSSLISLSQDDNLGIECNLVPHSTFGWSAEQILLDIFKTPTTRNFYVAERVGEILDLISKSNRNEPKIKEKVEKMIEQNLLTLSNEDPLKDVISKLIAKYGKS